MRADRPLWPEHARIPVSGPDRAARLAATARVRALAKPYRSLGRLEEIAVWLAAAQGIVPPRNLADVRVIVFAGDNRVARPDVFAWQDVEAATGLAAILAGTSGISVFARQVGARVRAFDITAAVDAPVQGSIDVEDALTRDEAERAFETGRAMADREIDEGADLLIPGDVGIGTARVASVLIAALLGLSAEDVAAADPGADDTRLRELAVTEAALERARATDPLTLIASTGGACAGAMTGFLVQSAVRRTPVILDGALSAAAALLAMELAPEAVRWWLAGHRSADRAHTAALAALGLEPVLDLGIRHGEGAAAVHAVPLLRSATAMLAEMPSLDEVR